MIFGQADRFAVSMELDEDHCGRMLYGKMCYWIEGRQFGDWDGGIPLMYTIMDFTTLVKDNGHRENCKMFCLREEEAFAAIDAVVRGFQGPAPQDLAECAARYNVFPTASIFQEEAAYLIECDGRAKLIYRSQDKNIHKLMLEGGEFDAVIRAAFDQLDSWYEREAPDDVA